ncbi:MAG: 1-deoxy-D-xylulose-5-phosphate reductoisomerase [bacterium]
MMKNITILGSSGSIGKQTLEVIKAHPEKFKITALAVNSNVKELEQQIKEFSPKAVAITKEENAEIIRQKFPALKVFSGNNAAVELVQIPEVDSVVVSVVGSAGILPTLKAIELKKAVHLANKETLVVAGDLINEALKKNNAKLMPPIDSEHSAIFQCLNGEDANNINKIIITCSGGAFKNHTDEELKNVKAGDALKHPTWNMGKKITIDCATLMNKGFEVIEAHQIFGVPYEKIEVLIHPESKIHSMVEFIDESIMAQIGEADMRVPIQYSLSYPERLNNNFKRLNFAELRSFTFRQPDTEKFPCLKYAIEVGKTGGTMPAVLNAANEICVQKFLEDKIKFLDIAKIIKQAMDAHEVIANPTLEQILEVDGWAREFVEKFSIFNF